MQITIRDLGGCRKELAVTVPAADVNAEIEKAYAGLRAQVSFPGFRPGKTPRSMLEKRFGGEIVHQVAHDLVERAVDKAVSDHKLELVSAVDPHSCEPTILAGADVTFAVPVEVKPEFELGAYRNIAVERKVWKVTEADLDRVLHDLRNRRAVAHEVGEEGYRPGDRVRVKLKATCNGATALEDEGMILGDPPTLPPFEFENLAAALSGTRKGGTVEIDSTFQKDYPDAQYAGQAARVSLDIVDVRRPELPALDDAFAKDLGHADLAAARADIQKRLTEGRTTNSNQLLEQKIIDRILESTPFEIAQGPVDRALESRIRKMVMEAAMAGVDEAKATADVERHRAEIRKVVERDARAWLIVEKIAKKEKIFAMEDDVKKRIAGLAAEHGAGVDEVAAYYEEKGLMPELRAEIVERKVLEFLRQHAVVTDIEEDAPKLGASAEGAA